LLILTVTIGLASLANDVFAQTEDLILEPRVEYTFGQTLVFSGDLLLIEDVVRAAVFYRPAGQGDTLYRIAELQEGLGIIATATINLERSPLPPFSSIEYWWQIDLGDGTTIKTDEFSFQYHDDRFEWQQLEDGIVQVFWSNGDPSMGQTAVDIANRSIPVIQKMITLANISKISIYIYPSLTDLQQALDSGGKTWVGGQADPNSGVLLLSAPAGAEGIIELESGLPHELTHLLIAQRMGAGYENIPSWLDEGLAVLQEGSPNPNQRIALEDAARSGTLLAMESLCEGFPFSDQQALLAYAQSASFVQYLTDQYGIGGINNLLDAYQEGTTCAGGVQRELQRSLNETVNEWKSVAVPQPNLSLRLTPFVPWFILTIPLLLLLVVILISSRRKKTR
jgi:hypothetical protein